MSYEISPKPAVITIFGITGDLAHKKVMPALYHVIRSGLLHEKTFIVGTSRRPVSPDDIVSDLRVELNTANKVPDKTVLAQLRNQLSMVQLNPDEADDFVRLKQHLQGIEDEAGICLEQYFYLSIPPQVYGTFIEHLGEQGLNQGCSHGTTSSRLLAEKPFGHDYASAEQLIAQTAKYFNEEQLFRIDHYLAKETAQNILTFRQQNPLFSQIWNGKHISKISITAAEEIGIAGRANFYDQIGALRDVTQSHLLQLLAITLMDIPAELSAQSVHEAKQAVLNAILPPTTDEVPSIAVRGQYDTYREEVNSPGGNTETYASVVLSSQNPNWREVPLKLTTGKALETKRTSITLDFGSDGVNRLQFRIQPNEGITPTLQVKQPGLEHAVTPTTMNFDYQTAFKLHDPLDAYERVLISAMRADHTLFATSDEVLASWRILQPILSVWQDSTEPITMYKSGSAGPDVTTLP